MSLSPAVILYDVSGNPIKVATDGSDYRLGAETKVARASDGAYINPATQETLESIKDTDGVKKIVDPLPAGTNELGKVAQGTKAAAADAWPHVLYDASGNPIKVATDGSDYRLGAETKIARASDGAYINPATQETLESIKDTDGIKKITDQLPAGTNEIGKVAQGTKASAAGAWPQVLYDANAHAIGVVLDGTLYRLQAESKIAKGVSDLVHLDAVDTASGLGRLKASLYTPEGEAVAFSSVPATASAIRNEFVKNGTSEDLLVDGSSTPVIFTYDADASQDISLQALHFTLASNSITFGNGYFGAVAGPLANGLKIEVVSGSVSGVVATIFQNEDFVNFASVGGFQWVVSSKDLMSATYVIGGGLKLYAGSSDRVKVTVQDDIASAGIYFKCFVKGNLLDAS